MQSCLYFVHGKYFCKLYEAHFFFSPYLSRYDPDILLGYEVQMHSWGYLLQRAAALNVDLCQMISRVPGKLFV